MTKKKETLSEVSQEFANVNGFNISKYLPENFTLTKESVFKENKARFFRITELSAQEQFTLRQDLENVLASMKNDNFSWVYYLSGTKVGIEIYMGIYLNGANQDDIVKQAKLLKNQLIGNIGGIQLEEIKSQGVKNNIIAPLQASKHFGVVMGVPSLTVDQQAHSRGENITQGLDRLATGLNGEDWQMLIVAKPENLSEVERKINQLLGYASDLHSQIKTTQQYGVNQSKTNGTSVSHSLTDQESTNYSFSENEGKNDGGSKSKAKSYTESSTKTDNEQGSSWSSGTSEQKQSGDTVTDGINWGTNKGVSYTQGDSQSRSVGKTDGVSYSEQNGTNETTGTELIDKKLERIAKHINEKQLERFELGQGKGLFQTAVYISAPHLETYERLSLAMTSIFQGNQMLFTPLQVQKIQLKDDDVLRLFDIHHTDIDGQLTTELEVVHGIPITKQQMACVTLLNASELSLLAGLPSREVCGIRLRKNVDFAVNTHTANKDEDFEMGSIIQNGQVLEYSKVHLNKKLLSQHIFISGVTGAGKTTTCQKILTQSGLPFLVIEPAKTEYRSLYQIDDSIQYYTVGNEKVSPFRLNPFELLPNEQLAGHIDMLKATFAAVFPMEASMPYLIEEAIVRSYELKGWDISTSTNFLYDNPYERPEECFPIMSELLEVLKQVIASKGFGRELQEKYEGSLISRLDNLTVGSKGRMLNTRVSIDVNKLLDQKAVIELDDLKDEQDKALLMGFLIGRVAEAVKQRHKIDVNFQHITLIEEAHRLLEKPDGADNAKKLGVSQFANLLAEVRKYGECLIIADQIPNKLTPEVLKNTNTKIIHRLFAADDREVLGETVGLSDEQKQFLPMLKAGEAVVYSAGWHEAVRMQVERMSDTNAPEIDEEIIAKASQKRIFAEKDRLYPKLSRMATGLDAYQFSQFVQDGLLLLNLWVRWHHNQEKLSSKQTSKDKIYAKQQHLLVERLYEKMGEFEQFWQSNMVVRESLVALFEDVAPLSYADISQTLTCEQCLLHLFGLYDSKQLHEHIDEDAIFGLSEGEEVVKDSLKSIFAQFKVL